MTDVLDEDWWDQVLADPRARCRPEDLEDGFIDDDFGDWGDWL